MSSVSSSTVTIADRPEADPLPKKVGEIGYMPPKSPKTPESSQNAPADETPLPARHPADHQEEAPAAASSPTPTAPAATSTDAPTNSASSIKKTWRQRLTIGGVSVFSILRILIFLVFIGGTAAAWVLTIKSFESNNSPAGPDDNSGDPNANSGFGPGQGNGSDGGDSQQPPPSFSSLVILHVSFTIVVLVELLFLERSIFHARAERYLYKHGMQRGGTSAAIGFAPWNRPPLPTYAAALAESGRRGTGDVEDGLIAMPPPPAYGHTRGSVLLLSGFLRDSLVRNLNRSSQGSSTSRSSMPMSPREMEEGRGSRPISYDASEEVDNAKRALELEAALSRLEHSAPTRD